MTVILVELVRSAMTGAFDDPFVFFVELVITPEMTEALNGEFVWFVALFPFVPFVVGAFDVEFELVEF